MTRCWEGPLGAVRPLDAPSWLTAEPLMIGQHRDAPLAWASGEALDDDHAGALAPGGAVGGGGERLHPSVGGQAALAGELDEGARRRT